MILFSHVEYVFPFISNYAQVKFVKITQLNLKLNINFDFYKEFFL